MARPLSDNPKHIREYAVLCVDPVSKSRKFFTRIGYKSYVLKEFLAIYPNYDISIYVLSSRVISNFK